MTSYENKEQKGLKILKAQYDDNKNILLVEDVIDTGKTIKKVKEFYPNAKVFALHYKEKGGIKPDYYLWITDKWIVYPWEFNEL